MKDDLARRLLDHWDDDGKRAPGEWVPVPEWLVIAAAGEIRKLQAIVKDLMDAPPEMSASSFEALADALRTAAES